SCARASPSPIGAGCSCRPRPATSRPTRRSATPVTMRRKGRREPTGARGAKQVYAENSPTVMLSLHGISTYTAALNGFGADAVPDVAKTGDDHVRPLWTLVAYYHGACSRP